MIYFAFFMLNSNPIWFHLKQHKKNNINHKLILSLMELNFLGLKLPIAWSRISLSWQLTSSYCYQTLRLTFPPSITFWFKELGGGVRFPKISKNGGMKLFYKNEGLIKSGAIHLKWGYLIYLLPWVESCCSYDFNIS